MSDPGTTADTGAGAIPRQETATGEDRGQPTPVDLPDQRTGEADVVVPEAPARAELSEPAQGPVLPRPASDLLPAHPARPSRFRLPALPRLPRPFRPESPRDEQSPLPVLAGVLSIVLVVGLLVTATVRSGAAATRAETAAAAATAAAESVAAQAYPLRPGPFVAALDTLIAQADPLAEATRGPSWTASRWTTRANRLGLLDHQADGLGRLADTARPLRLSVLNGTSGTPTPDRVHTLAADLAAYADAARASDLTYDEGVRQLAAAAESLRLMLGGTGATVSVDHLWTICETAAGPCTRLTVRAAQVVDRTTVAADAGPLATGDARFTGVAASTLVSGRRLLITGLLDTLMRAADPAVAAGQRPVVQVLRAA
ncbi:hypothetical protein ACIB24_21270 [Spongisporangium articulatum]|uniref:Uncharacterized protein n=1 Tax=Spongisporangium articulatum TaxID=3362603 RepID=A0ABW8ATA4_9ACTN